jgi:hypothetical protein
MEERVKIRFKDGTELEASVNGNNFITDEAPEFPDDLSEVVIVSDGGEEVIKNVTVQQAAGLDDRYWFIFVAQTPLGSLESQVLYTAMMTDTLLEEA